MSDRLAEQLPSTHGPARLTFADAAEVDEFAATLERYEKGEITAEQWRAFRLLRGAYGQRQTDDSSMVRIKIPQGILHATQLRAIANAADTWSRGFGHITTRQNIQLHFVRLHDVEKVLREVAEVGVTTRTACGNSVRNITSCPYAGVLQHELFDVTPYARALTNYFLRHPLAGSLPRKFKIAFEGCAEDHALTAINDLGFTAKVREVNGQTVRGFRVTVGGGTSILCKTGQALVEFLPVGELFELAEAVLRVFHALGDREHRQRNRLKFLIKELGWEKFVAEVEARRASFKAEGGAALPFDPEHPPIEPGPEGSRPPPPSVAECAARAAASKIRGPGAVLPKVEPELSPPEATFARWRKTNVLPHRESGYSVAVATVILGDLSSEQMRVLSDLAYSFGDGTLRVSPTQNLVFPWVRTLELGELYRRLAALGLGLADSHTFADVTSCPGAESCKLAVTQSRGLGRLLGDFLRARPDLVDAVPGLDIKISGCPNGCGQHHIAGIGFQGSVRKVGTQIVPQYFVLLGGGVGAEAKFGRIAAKVPARRMTQTLERLVNLYLQERKPGEEARAFFQRVELARVKALLADLETLTAQTLAPDDLVDLGENTTFTVETQEGECAA